MDLSKRLISLDILRGLTIAGMVVVNDPGSWSYVYPPLRHASWHGVTPTDLVFPFFLFIVGISIVLAYSKRLQTTQDTGPLINKIIIRTAMIFGVGLFLAVSFQNYGFKLAQVVAGGILIFGLSEIQGDKTARQKWILAASMAIVVTLLLSMAPDFSFSKIRIPGVLQRIALVFLVCAVIFLKTGWRTQAIWLVVVLVGYWLMMTLIPVPIDAVVQGALASGEVLRSSGNVPIEGLRAISDGFIAPNLEPGVNLQAWLDRVLIPGRIWEKTWDPEGLLSTLPAIGTGLAGMLAGHIVISKNSEDKKINYLFVYGFAMLLIGNVWDWFFPINKNLWSSSYVMYAGGLSCLTFAALYWFIDYEHQGKSNWLFYVGKVFGANAITAYALHSLFARVYGPIQKPFMSGLMGAGLPGEFASLLWALLYTMFIFSIVWVMYRKKVFLKL